MHRPPTTLKGDGPGLERDVVVGVPCPAFVPLAGFDGLFQGLFRQLVGRNHEGGYGVPVGRPGAFFPVRRPVAVRHAGKSAAQEPRGLLMLPACPGPLFGGVERFADLRKTKRVAADRQPVQRVLELFIKHVLDVGPK